MCNFPQNFFVWVIFKRTSYIWVLKSICLWVIISSNRVLLQNSFVVIYKILFRGTTFYCILMFSTTKNCFASCHVYDVVNSTNQQNLAIYLKKKSIYIYDSIRSNKIKEFFLRTKAKFIFVFNRSPSLVCIDMTS